MPKPGKESEGKNYKSISLMKLTNPQKLLVNKIQQHRKDCTPSTNRIYSSNATLY